MCLGKLWKVESNFEASIAETVVGEASVPSLSNSKLNYNANLFNFLIRLPKKNIPHDYALE